MEEVLFGRIRMTIPDAQFRVSTDSMVLADFCRDAGGRGLDLGCGCGTLGLLLLGSGAAGSVCGIEIQPEAARQAEENARRNGLADRFSVVCGDLRQAHAQIPAGSFDFAVSNPPYYPPGSGRLRKEDSLSLARSELYCPLDALCAAAARALRWGGRLYLVSDATSFNNKTSTALVWAELSTAALTRLCSQYAENGQTTAIYCTDGSNIFTVRSPGSVSAPAALVVDIQDAVLNEFTGSTETKVDAAEYLRIVQPVGSWSLWTASYAGTDALREVTASFAVWIGVQTIIMLLAVGIFLFLVWRLITKPFRQIAKQLQTMEQTGMLLPDPNGGPAISNDMDFLHYAFAQLGSQLQATLEQAYHNKELAYQSEIKYLQAQINPHFLYNSFYHLYRMAKMEDTDGIAEMSLKLSSYYRYITRSAQPVVTLAMEYQNIVDYTEIQTIRFGDRITVQLQPLPEPYRELAVPRFILQPLFENAYNHGVEKMENGLIQLRFKMKPEFLNIYVENNGSCPDAELEKLTQYLNSTDRKAECTALKNVKLRMQMQGGDLQVSHGTLGGFGVSLRLPLHPAHSLNTEQQNGQPQKEETSHADTVACG